MKQSFVLVMSLDSLVKEKNVKVLWITSIFFLTSILSLKYINKKIPIPQILVTIFIKINMTHFFLNS